MSKKKSVILLAILVLCIYIYPVEAWSLFSPPSPPPSVINASNYSTIGICGPGYVVQNVTNGGPQCVAASTGAGTGGSVVYGAFNYTNIHGSDCTGADGDTARTYGISNLNIVVIDNYVLHPSIDYSFAAGTLTFVGPVWNDQDISLYYASNPLYLNYTSYNFYGNMTNGTSGDRNRVLALGNITTMIAVDNYMLHPLIDFTISGTNVTFLNNMWDDQPITVWVSS